MILLLKSGFELLNWIKNPILLLYFATQICKQVKCQECAEPSQVSFLIRF